MRDPNFVIPFDELPDRFAESVENPPAVPVEARPAATIVLLRDGSEGLEALLMRRSRRSGFVPGAYVFPGGRVDRSDAAPAVLERTIGLSAEAAAERLAMPDADPPAVAYYLAALREAFEETGIMIGVGPEGAPPHPAAEDRAVERVREDLMERRIAFAEALDRLGCRLAGDSVEYIAHWITPEAEPRRYDTRFFAAKVRPGATPRVDPREMTDALWIPPSDALARTEGGKLPMVFPTIRTLERLLEYPTADDALADLARAPVPTIMPRLVVTPTGIGMRLDEDG
jgi:8-oxo-dGTP pyrophosphatase MutT (NUDIX family)